MDDLARLRGWYAEDLRLRTPVRRNPAVVEAFAAVPRERFLGPGPWRILSDNRLDQPFETPDDAPHWLYHDVLVAIDPARRLNNGLPSFWAHNFDYLDLRRGERVLQVGAGTGYYSALLAEMVGPHGRVTAVEYDAALAVQARENLGNLFLIHFCFLSSLRRSSSQLRAASIRPSEMNAPGGSIASRKPMSARNNCRLRAHSPN